MYLPGKVARIFTKVIRSDLKYIQNKTIDGRASSVHYREGNHYVAGSKCRLGNRKRVHIHQGYEI